MSVSVFLALFIAGEVGRTPFADMPLADPDKEFALRFNRSATCFQEIGVKWDAKTAKTKERCEELSEPKRWRGVWRVEFEGSVFFPEGWPNCWGKPNCRHIWLEGDVLPWPGRWACKREFEINLIGRRNVLPGAHGGTMAEYKIVAEELISAKRLPDPYDENCDPELHPELKTN